MPTVSKSPAQTDHGNRVTVVTRAELSVLRWRLQLMLKRVPTPFDAHGGKRVLLITESDPIPQAQIFPFRFFRKALAERGALQIREVRVTEFESRPDASPSDADVVLVQTWFDWSAARLAALFDHIRALNPKAKVVYLDWFAPTDLRLAQYVHGRVDNYVKKHLLRDRSLYGQPTRGDTNLTHYFGTRFKHDYQWERFPIPTGFLNKVVIGPSFSTAPRLLPYFFHRPGPSLVTRVRSIDLHARLAAGGEGWYQSMRQHAVDAVKALPGYEVRTGAGVAYRRYMRELQDSRACFSPFGYGEVCWRDFEAIKCGALLFKPDMSHVETMPDVFEAEKTYVPLAWDLSDFADKLHWWTTHDTARQRVTQSAYCRLHEFSRGSAILVHLWSLLK